MQDIPTQIIQAAQAGDMEAFRDIYKSSSGLVYSIAYRMTADRDLAYDVAQEVFVKVFRNLKAFEFRSAFKTWLYRIAVNTAINALRRKPRELFLEEIMENPESDPRVSVVDNGKFDQQDAKAKLDILLQQLNPDQRSCIILREIQGLNYKEIAQALKININTVRSRLARARQGLMNAARNAPRAGDGKNAF